MKKSIFLVLAISIICVSCSSPSQLPQYSYTETHSSAIQIDADGWYLFPSLKFKGGLKNGMPDGSGECVTTYSYPKIDSLGDKYDETETIRAACEFKNGLRIDSTHLARMKSVGSKFRSVQNTEDNNKRAAAIQEAKEYRESQRQMDLAVYGTLNKIQQDSTSRLNAMQASNQQLENYSNHRYTNSDDSDSSIDSSSKKSNDSSSKPTKATQSGSPATSPSAVNTKSTSSTAQNNSNSNSTSASTTNSTQNTTQPQSQQRPTQQQSTQSSTAANKPATVSPANAASVPTSTSAAASPAPTGSPTKKCDLPSGSSMTITSNGYTDCNFEYQLVSVEGIWNQCEATREGALFWANESIRASEECATLGSEWYPAHTGDKMLQFAGYNETPACVHGQGWTAKITKASLVCKRPKPRSSN